MPASVSDKLAWLLLILPGFISMFIIGLIVDLGQLSEFQITYYSLVLTFINLIVAVPIYWLIEYIICDAFNLIATASRMMQAAFLLSVVSVSSLTGIGFGLAAERDVFFVTLRSLPITGVLNKRSSSRPLVFLLSQNTAGKLKEEGDGRPSGKVTEAWVRISLNDGVVYEGWPEFYGLGQEPSEIYLSPACVVNGRDIEPIGGPGVIIKEDEIRTVTLLDREESACFEVWLG